MPYTRMLIMALLCVYALLGCSSSNVIDESNDSKPMGKLNYEDPVLVYREMAEQLADSLLASPVVREIAKDRKPVVWIDTIINKSIYHIDTEKLHDIIARMIIDSSTFQIFGLVSVEFPLEGSMEESIEGTETAESISYELPADIDYILQGGLSSAEQSTRNQRVISYEMTLSLVNVKTKTVVWMDTKQTTRMYAK